MNDAVKYFEQDKRRDPTQARTEWLIKQLITRPRRADELERMSENNGLGFAGTTYKRDLRGLINRRLVHSPMQTGGVYTISSDGLAWAQVRGLLK